MKKILRGILSVILSAGIISGTAFAALPSDSSETTDTAETQQTSEQKTAEQQTAFSGEKMI